MKTEEIENGNALVDSFLNNSGDSVKIHCTPTSIDIATDLVTKTEFNEEARKTKLSKDHMSSYLEISNDALTKDEWEQLITQHKIHGNKWSEIATAFPGRAPHYLMHCWNHILRKRFSLTTNGGDLIDGTLIKTEIEQTETRVGMVAGKSNYEYCGNCGYAIHVSEVPFHNCRKVSNHTTVNHYSTLPNPASNQPYNTYYPAERKNPYYETYNRSNMYTSSDFNNHVTNPYNQSYSPQKSRYSESRQHSGGTPRLPPIEIKEEEIERPKKENNPAFEASKQEASKVIEFLKGSAWNKPKEKVIKENSTLSLSRSSDEKESINQSEYEISNNEYSRENSGTNNYHMRRDESEEFELNRGQNPYSVVGYYNQRNAQGKFVKIESKPKAQKLSPNSVQPRRRGRKSKITLMEEKKDRKRNNLKANQNEETDSNKAKRIKYDLYEASFDEENSLSDSFSEETRPRSECHRFVELSVSDFDTRLTRANRRKVEENIDRKVNCFTTKRKRKPRKNHPNNVKEGSPFMYLLDHVAEVYQMEMMIETTNFFLSDRTL